ncbi:MAG: [Oscillospiraceae bacterium]|nr:[FeFe] hydrogenase H-cluster maturation GTPase HydF [Oscillospiraceae bacterium]
MSLNQTLAVDRIHIGFFGKTNSGKSSLVNAIANQQVSLVSEISGTTTDPVKKAIEILPLGPCMLIDTAGLDDESALGKMRIKRTEELIETVDIAIIAIDAKCGISELETNLISIFSKNAVPYIIAYTKSDLYDISDEISPKGILLSAKTGFNIDTLKNALAAITVSGNANSVIVSDKLKANDVVVLVTPIDESAPKGRLILPQQQTIRDILDAGAIAIVTKETGLERTLSSLKNPPALVITDSQAFGFVSKIVPQSVPLTSFSILMARYKGFLEASLEGVKALERLKGGEKILVSEGCTHHRQCNDIGRTKIPAMVQKFTKLNFEFEFTSGQSFPEDLSGYALCIHCGGCMLKEREMQRRLRRANAQNVPFTNYGVLLAFLTNTLERTANALDLL